VFLRRLWEIAQQVGVWELTNRTESAGTYVLASWLFLRLLGLIYLTAFVSLATQIRGLVGRKGILPAAGIFVTRLNWGASRFWRWPTLCWFNCSDRALLFLSWGGAGLALLLMVGVAQVPILVLLWIFYLSLFTVCRLFLCYQWDILLLEAGFLACFLAPPDVKLHFFPKSSPPALCIWLFWWLLFRLMFWSGAVKLREGDSTWRKLSALKYHYETQPLPTRLAWYAHQLPLSIHRVCAVVVFGIELIAPFLIVAAPTFRYVACGLFVLFMVLIQLTGNYAFFNLLGIALSFLLLDDRALGPVFRFIFPGAQAQVVPPPGFASNVAIVFSLLVIVLSLESMARALRLRVSWPQPLVRFFDILEPFHLVNSYGLFSVMTTWRAEIIMEGSNDGRNWLEYEFKFKPGDLRRAPCRAAPHQPRLDWQMWFAALGAEISTTWFECFCDRLTEGSPVVLGLLKRNPFPEAPPRYVRGVLYDYRFTSWPKRRATGEWWCRVMRGIYKP
jgi:hypothetical protein